MPDSESVREALPRYYTAWRAWADEHAGGDGYYVQDGYEIGYEQGRADERKRFEALVAAASRAQRYFAARQGRLGVYDRIGRDLYAALAALKEEVADA